MKKNKGILSIYQKILGQSTSSEAEMKQWLEESEDNRNTVEEIKQIFHNSKDYLPNYEPDVEAGLHSLKNRIAQSKKETLVISLPAKKTNYNWLKIAASIALLIGAFAVSQFYFNTTTALTALNTGIGELQSVTLADGTTVKLNENSSLYFPESFDGVERQVELQGEAYFDVTKNVDQPFVITTDKTTIRVLGTSFSVRAMDAERMTKVTVETGKVEVISNDKEEKVLLNPYETGIHKHGANLEKARDQDLKDIAWHTLDFRAIPFTEIVKTMERHYGISLDYSKANLGNCSYTINFAQSDLGTTLEVMRTNLKVDIEKISEGKYQISKGICSE